MPSSSDVSPREEILQAAIEVFTAKGVFDSTIADIARAVGMQRASIYHHFDDKDAILIAIVMPTYGRLIDLVQELDTLTDRGELKLHHFLEVEVREALAFPRPWRAAYFAVTDQDPVRRAVDAAAAQLVEAWVRWIEAAMEDGSLTPGDPRSAAALVEAAYTGVNWIAQDDASQDPDALAAAFAAFVLGGLGATPRAVEQIARQSAALR